MLADLHISDLAAMPPNKRNAAIRKLTEQQADQLLHDWSFIGRPDQIAPAGDWRTWLYLAGRGAGKTRSGAEWVRQKVKDGNKRIGLIAPTAADARDVMVEGTSGILACAWARDEDVSGNHMGRPIYEPSKRRLTWANGAQAALFSAEEPERLRGPQVYALWCDELAAWPNAQEVWDMAMFGLRLGNNPQAVVTTTPRAIPLIRKLIKSDTTMVTRASTYANRANLADQFFTAIITKYEGTRLGRQELDGELIEEVDGALWSIAMLEQARVEAAPELRRVVVAIDPAVSSKAESNLTGIIVAGLGVDGRGYVLADLSGRYSPDGWARKAIGAFDTYKADRIVAEGNQGGEMVRHTIQSARPNMPVRIVHASRGKMARAEPIAALYEQGKVRHVGRFGDLEDQLATWEPLGNLPSPDRLDAMVWALTSLMISPVRLPAFGVYRNH
jgi:phage terminase large subunit-like protein